MSNILFVLPVPCLAGIKLELRPHAFQCLQGGRKPRSSGDRTHQLSALASPRFVRMVCRCLMKLHGHPSTLIQAREAFGKCRSDKVFGLGLTLFPECPVCGFAKLRHMQEMELRREDVVQMGVVYRVLAAKDSKQHKRESLIKVLVCIQPCQSLFIDFMMLQKVWSAVFMHLRLLASVVAYLGPQSSCIHKLSICLSACLATVNLIYLSIYLPIHLTICLYIYLSAYLAIYLPIYLSVYLFVCLSVRLSVRLSVCLSVCLSVRRSIYL